LPGQDLDAWLTRRKVASTTVSAASGAPEQANQLQDLVTATKIDALVILPFESAALTRPVQQVHGQGRVRDRAAPSQALQGSLPPIAAVWAMRSRLRCHTPMTRLEHPASCREICRSFAALLPLFCRSYAVFPAFSGASRGRYSLKQRETDASLASLASLASQTGTDSYDRIEKPP